MTCEELIEELKKYPPDMEIFIVDEFFNGELVSEAWKDKIRNEETGEITECIFIWS